MTTKKVERRIKIKYRIRKNVFGTAERPRLSVFRSNKQIYAQVINDLEGKTLAAASSIGLEAMPKIQQAEKVGELVAQKAQERRVERQTGCHQPCYKGNKGRSHLHIRSYRRCR